MSVRVHRFVAPALVPLVWILVKYGFAVPDRYLPSPWAVIAAINSIDPPILVHFVASWLRLAVGYATGVFIGVSVGIAWWRSPRFFDWSSPSVQALRSVPATATVPFFLLWFGFAEWGRLLLIMLGISLNIAIATHQILGNVPRKYLVAIRSGGLAAHEIPLRRFALPIVLESLLPTLRFALSTAIGLVVVSEILGSQTGLGYLIQTARSTFSMQLIFLAAVGFGIINAISDAALQFAWRRTVFWRQAS